MELDSETLEVLSGGVSEFGFADYKPLDPDTIKRIRYATDPAYRAHVLFICKTSYLRHKDEWREAARARARRYYTKPSYKRKVLARNKRRYNALKQVAAAWGAVFPFTPDMPDPASRQLRWYRKKKIAAAFKEAFS